MSNQQSAHNLRFSGAPWYENVCKASVLIVGAGGIGSWVALNMARAGFNVTIIDDDVISAHNIGGQLYRTSQIGESKVDATSDIVKEFTGRDIVAIHGRFKENDLNRFYNVVVSAVDNLTTRRELSRTCKRDDIPLFIDGRMSAESMTIHTCRTNDEYYAYEVALPPENSVSEGPCTFRATTFNGSIIGGLITSLAVSAFVLERDIPRTLRIDLPLFNAAVQW